MTTDSPQSVVPKGTTRHGLVIGIDKYVDERLNLRCAVADARALHALMVDPECGCFPHENVQLLLDSESTTDRIFRALARFRKHVAENDVVWIYYAGHAAVDDNVYWVTYDTDVDDLFATALSSDRINSVLSQLRTKNVVFILDCCHAAAMALVKNPTRAVVTAKDVFARFQGHGRITLAASDGKQKSVELSEVGHGAFTYFLVKGLRGEADRDNDGIVTADELWSYLRHKVTDASRRVGSPQTPILSGSMTHDVPLTLSASMSAKKQRLMVQIEKIVGIPLHQLTADQGRFCAEIVARGPRTDYERLLLESLEELAAGQLTELQFRRIVQMNMQIIGKQARLLDNQPAYTTLYAGVADARSMVEAAKAREEVAVKVQSKAVEAPEKAAAAARAGIESGESGLQPSESALETKASFGGHDNYATEVRKTVASIGAIAIIVGGALIGCEVIGGRSGGLSDTQSAALVTAIEALDRGISTIRAEVHLRASSLSDLPLFRSALATDPALAADVVAGTNDVSGESLELGRVNKATRKAEPLLRTYRAIKMSHEGIAGIYLDLVDDRIVITEVQEVVPTLPVHTTEEYFGYLCVTRSLALGPVINALSHSGVTGKLVINGSAAAIGQMPDNATMREQPLGSQYEAYAARIIVAEPPPHAVVSLPNLVGGVGAAVVGILLLVMSALGMPYPKGTIAAYRLAAQPTTPPPESGALGDARTQLAQHAFAEAGTPVPVDPPAAPQVIRSSLGPGATIGRWEVVRRIGSGGMADVYLAQTRGDGDVEKRVAIKIMHGHLAGSPRGVDHFLDEARLTARIHHPNIVAILDLGKIGDDYVIVMEYIDGVDLEHLLLSARAGERLVPLDVGLGILCRICEGLDAAHRATGPDGTPLGIIHRDVKSANVLVSRQGNVKVVDFGVANAANQIHFTLAGETAGTPAKMAPEQRVGEKVDVRADVYSVAVVGYELVTGKSVNLDLASLSDLGVENWPHLPPPSSLRDGLPAEFDDILLHGMAFEPERRPANCAVFGALCERIMRQYKLVASDQDIARWVEAEMRYLSPR